MNRQHFYFVSALLILTGCGGGDDAGSDKVSPAAPETMLDINPANAEQVTLLSYESAAASASLGELVGDTGLIANSPGGNAKLDGSFGTASKTGRSASRVPIPATTENCDVDGTVTVSGDIKDPFTPTLTAGDFFDVKFSTCDDGLGDVTDGLLHLEVFDFAGEFLAGLYELSMDFTITDFQVATIEDTVTMNGDARIVLDTTASPYVEAGISGSALTVDSNSSSESLFDFAATQTLDAGVSPSPYTLAAAGTLDSTQLTGAIRYSTPVSFQGFDNGYPVAGELLVEGENSSARLAVLEDGKLRIDVDSNGDGTADSTIFTTWQELESL